MTSNAIPIKTFNFSLLVRFVSVYMSFFSSRFRTLYLHCSLFDSICCLFRLHVRCLISLLCVGFHVVCFLIVFAVLLSLLTTTLGFVFHVSYFASVFSCCVFVLL